MGELDLAAIRARYEAATEGPWINAHGEFVSQAETYIAICRVNRPVLEDIVAGKTILAPRGAEQANEDFIAHARTDLPAVVEALEEAQKKLEAVRTQAAGALECAANDLEASAEGVEFERGENVPWVLVRKSIDRILKEE